MLKKIFLSILVLASIFQVSAKAESFDPLDRMPILKDQPISLVDVPIAQRGIEYRKFLAASVRIDVEGAMGSGTIIYYDSNENTAYVASCGHLFTQGTLSAQEAKRKKIPCKIVAYYHNDVKLSSPKSYTGKVIFYSYIDGQDTSLMTFTPDWEPEYFPIAPADYTYKIGTKAHSVGSDAGSEAGHYSVELEGIQWGDLVTHYNSPRPGRSGGGLMDENLYIGTCWGTEYVNGSGRGFFTPLSAIHKYWSQQKDYVFLLNQKPGWTLARKISIIDRNKTQGKYTPDYILMPYNR
jgi:hypothetical protein